MSDAQKKITATVLVVVALVVLVGMVWRNFGSEEVRADVRYLMDANTGKVYPIPTEDLKLPWPMANPSTGEKTLYPTEVCYWGEECKKHGGTRVIMNKYLGKEGPTKCPICGHVVRLHNPRPPDYNP
ncbi:MAG: hypothetical protein KAV82_02605 [Phycisphaerae bacterium]|nr:hypothetical protein [Phycisphaerae bacterium]